jgi:hypothetical protein
MIVEILRKTGQDFEVAATAAALARVGNALTTDMSISILGFVFEHRKKMIQVNRFMQQRNNDDEEIGEKDAMRKYCLHL